MGRKKSFRFTRKKRKSKQILEKEKLEKIENENVKYLKEIYYDVTSPVAFSPLNRLVKYVKTHNKGKQISSDFIQSWLEGQDSFTLHKQPQKPRHFPRLYSYKHGQQKEIDIAFFRSAKNTLEKILIVIDVFSRHLYAEPIPSLQSHHVIKAMEKILNQEPDVKQVRGDAGVEFKNAPFLKMMDDHNIKMIRAFPPRKSVLAERSIRSLKSLIYKLMQQKGINDFTKVIEDAVSVYNHRPHKSLDQLSPLDATKLKNRGRIQNFLHDQHLKKTGPMNPPFKFESGSAVRIEVDQGPFTKDYENKYSTEIYFITDRFRKDNVNYYKLETGSGEKVTGTFHETELTPVSLTKHTEHKIQQVYPESRKVGKTVYKRVKFAGFPEPKWIPEKDIFDL